MINIEEKTEGARYSENLQAVLENLKAKEILFLEYESDYQGFVDIEVLLEDGRIFSYKYWYGSCSGCDDWEARELTDNQIEAEMLKDAAFFDNIEQYNEYIKMKKK